MLKACARGARGAAVTVAGRTTTQSGIITGLLSDPLVRSVRMRNGAQIAYCHRSDGTRVGINMSISTAPKNERGSLVAARCRHLPPHQKCIGRAEKRQRTGVRPVVCIIPPHTYLRAAAVRDIHHKLTSVHSHARTGCQKPHRISCSIETRARVPHLHSTRLRTRACVYANCSRYLIRATRLRSRCTPPDRNQRHRHPCAPPPPPRPLPHTRSVRPSFLPQCG